MVMETASFSGQLKQVRKFTAVSASLASTPPCLCVSQAGKKIGAPVTLGKVRKLSNVQVMTT